MTMAVVGDPAQACARYFRKLDEIGLDYRRYNPYTAVRPQLEQFHSPSYVARTLEGWSDEWVGRRPDLAQRAVAGVGAGVRAAKLVWSGAEQRVFAPSAGHPHASSKVSDRMSIFNDVVITADWFTRRNWRVCVIDLDGLYAEPLEYALRYNTLATTISIHDMCPGSDNVLPSLGTFNIQMQEDAGDGELVEAVTAACHIMEDTFPDVVLLNVGSTGHSDDELTSLEYSLDGIYEAVVRISQTADEVTNGRMVALGGVASAHSEWQSTILAAATHAMSLPYFKSSAIRQVPSMVVASPQWSIAEQR